MQHAFILLQLAHAAVNHQLGADDERGFVGGEKHRRVGDLVRVGEGA